MHFPPLIFITLQRGLKHLLKTDRKDDVFPLKNEVNK